jgi:branched-chain amino acid transport system ATP-binding protein
MALLDAQDVNVRYRENQAVRDVSLSVDVGQIAGLIGPNGAGKTTLFNAVSGVQQCSGTVHLDGVDVSSASPQRRAHLGMSRTFQRLEVFGSMTAYDNIRTAAEIAARGRRAALRESTGVADGIVDLLDLHAVAGRRADSLPTGQARLVELGRALATSPKVLLLDEPASGLDELETARLAEVIASLRDRGTAVLLVEHDIDFVMTLSSTVYVLDLGMLIAAGTPEEVRENAAVQAAYLGSAA